MPETVAALLTLLNATARQQAALTTFLDANAARLNAEFTNCETATLQDIATEVANIRQQHALIYQSLKNVRPVRKPAKPLTNS